MSYLAFRGLELPFFAIAVVFLFLYGMGRRAERERESKRRMELLERALQSGHVDEATKRQLVAAVAAQPMPWHPVLAMGWVGLVAGLGLLVLASFEEEFLPAAVMLTAVAFGVVSTPIAMRELRGRSVEAAAKPRSQP